ncbi:hypothetical protein TrST_g8777 [Triparma strigata]|uniref:EF-hand domain-containing protein n=1 Tax=Triparma strigata TaxID=1606541 RepID=A0A9W7EDB2_9STRA|nr:hypothetical protein TrST_g8777 [Triparma strigata]
MEGIDKSGIDASVSGESKGEEVFSGWTRLEPTSDEGPISPMEKMEPHPNSLALMKKRSPSTPVGLGAGFPDSKVPSNKKQSKKQSNLSPSSPDQLGSHKSPAQVKATLRKSNFLSALDLSNAVSKGVKDNFLLVRTAEELDSESEESEDSQTRRHKKMMMKKRERRHSISEGIPPKARMTMLHELRQFYDIDYRTFLVKAQLRTLAANELKLGPYISKMEASKAEAAWLFSLVDEDDSGLIDTDELKDMIEKTGQRVKDEELEHIMSVLDEDCSGEVDDIEFSAWYADDSDLWLSQRRRHPRDHNSDAALLRRESRRFDKQIIDIIEDFWRLVDVDGNGEIDEDEYIDLSVHLQQAMIDYENEKNKNKKKQTLYFHEHDAILTAKKEWQVDSQGSDHLDYHRFQLCFFQIADAWSKTDDVKGYCQVLGDLLSHTSIPPKKGGNRRRWRWERRDSDASSLMKVKEPSPKSPKRSMKSPKSLKKTIRSKVVKKNRRATESKTEAKEEAAPEVVEEEEKKVQEPMKGLAKFKPPTPKPRKSKIAEVEKVPEGGGKLEIVWSPKPKRAPIVKKPYERPGGDNFDEQSSVTEDTFMRLRREAAESFEWRPPPELFSPKERMRSGIGTMAGVASFGGYDPKGDSDKKVKALEKRNDMRKRNSDRNVFAKTNSCTDLRMEVNVVKLAEIAARKKRSMDEKAKAKLLNKFADPKQFWKIIDRVKQRVEEEGGGGGEDDTSSLGHAAKTLLEGWESMSTDEQDIVSSVLHTSTAFVETFVEGGMEPQEARSAWNAFYQIGGKRRPRSAVAAFGKVGDRNWEEIGLDRPGIGPIVDTNGIFYPQDMDETMGKALHQEGRFVTGERGEEGFFVSAWGGDGGRGRNNNQEEVERPHTVGGGRRRKRQSAPILRGGLEGAEGGDADSDILDNSHVLGPNSSTHDSVVVDDAGGAGGAKKKKKKEEEEKEEKEEGRGKGRERGKGKVFRPILFGD